MNARFKCGCNFDAEEDNINNAFEYFVAVIYPCKKHKTKIDNKLKEAKEINLV